MDSPPWPLDNPKTPRQYRAPILNEFLDPRLIYRTFLPPPPSHKIYLLRTNKHT